MSTDNLQLMADLSPPQLRQILGSSGWRSNGAIEGYWDVRYKDNAQTLMSIRADGYLEVSNNIRAAKSVGSSPQAGVGCALLSLQVGPLAAEGWCDRAAGHCGQGVHELLRLLPEDSDTLLTRICGSADVVMLEGRGRRIRGASILIEAPLLLEARCKLFRDFQTSIDFELFFDITPYGTLADLSSILRFTVTTHDIAGRGDCMPAFFFSPGTTQLMVTMGHEGDHDASLRLKRHTLPIGKTTRVGVRLTGSKFSALIGGQEVGALHSFAAKYDEEVRVAIWASDDFHPAADAAISNLTYLPLQDWTSLGKGGAAAPGTAF
jgi:hypothetical protein